MKKILIISYAESSQLFSDDLSDEIFMFRIYDFEKNIFYEHGYSYEFYSNFYLQKYEKFLYQINDHQFNILKNLKFNNLDKKQFMKDFLEEWLI